MLSYPCDAMTTLSAMELFEELFHRQPVSYSAFLNVDGYQILSFSPELFFRIEDGRIVTRPMKGTMPRGRDSREDIEAAQRLQQDEKRAPASPGGDESVNRAERD